MDNKTAGKAVEPLDALLTGLERLGQEQLLKDIQALNTAYVRLFITIPEQLKGEEDGNKY